MDKTDEPKDYPYPRYSLWETIMEVAMEIAGFLLILSFATAMIAVTIFLSLCIVYLQSKIPK